VQHPQQVQQRKCAHLTPAIGGEIETIRWMGIY